MSIGSLFLKSPVRSQLFRKLPGKKDLSILTVDVTKSEIIKGSVELTKHPVEDNADIGDHGIIKPRTLALEVIFSADGPLNLASSIPGLVAAGTGAVAASIGKKIGKAMGPSAALVGGSPIVGEIGTIAGGAAGKSVAGLLGLSQDDRLQTVVTELEQIRKAKSLLNILTALQSYKNFFLVDYTVTKDSPISKIKVSLMFEELFVVSTLKTKVKVPSVLNAVPNADQGTKVGQVLDATRGKSFAKFLLDFGTGKAK